MKQRIFRSICIIALISLVLLDICVVVLIYQKSTRDGYESLQRDAIYVSTGIKTGGMDYLQAIDEFPGRVTLINQDGTVLFDDQKNPANMDNHAERREVRDALLYGAGQVQRRSDTLDERTLYYAMRLEDGAVIRLSIQAASVWAEVMQFVPWLCGIALLLVGMAAFTANWQTGRILTPINTLDLDKPVDTDAYEELAPFLKRISEQKGQIDQQLAELKRQQEEFSAITQNMDEGLVVVDHTGAVMTVNQSARRILSIDPSVDLPASILETKGHQRLYEVVMEAVSGGRVERILDLGGRRYRLVASSSNEEIGPRGAVLLLIDDTEKLMAEQSRREFSANVSHELKTPLTSISGYAEIIRDGLVNSRDITTFAGKIYEESARLLSLINDIIRLSHLDEKQALGDYEPVNLLQLARQTARRLEKTATDKDISLSVEGGEIELSGVRSMLQETFYNLMDNAIRYTSPGGSVTVTVGKLRDSSFFRVADTGIGIPAAYQTRLFERFYRVDKSHSRESGGTGLGLSIAKRGAAFHGGRVELCSEVGKGSVFTVWFPSGACSHERK